MDAMRRLAYRLWWTWGTMRLGSDVLRAQGHKPPGGQPDER
jgi:hypothetical protein